MSAGQYALDQLDERVRLLGSTLVDLGWDVAFHQLADELPDARARLAHVAQMTETAANKVLDLVDEAQLRCGPAAAQASEYVPKAADSAEIQRLSSRYFKHVDRKEYDAAYAMFSDEMRAMVRRPRPAR